MYSNRNLSIVTETYSHSFQ